MANDIYDKHRAAFRNVSAYVILKNGERVATIAFKFPKDGASRLWAYVHWLGVPMVRGYAGGYGYDKMTAACASAARRIPALDVDSITHVERRKDQEAFITALEQDGGHNWDTTLRNAGFDVLQAV